MIHPNRQQRGSAMVYVTGLILVISIVIASTLQWHKNMAAAQTNNYKVEQAESELVNVDRLIHAAARKNLWNNEPNVFKDLQDSVDGNTTRKFTEPYGGIFLGASFESDSSPTWMSTTIFSNNPAPNPANPLYHLYSVTHNLNVTYTLHLLEKGSLTDGVDVQGTADPEQFRTIVDGKSTVHFREIPTCQVQLTAVDKLDTAQFGIPVQVNGTAFIPFGMTGGASQQNGSLMATRVVTPTQWLTGGSFSAQNARIQPAITASWMMDPYRLLEGNDTGNFATQKYFPKCQGPPFDEFHNVLQFDGHELTQTSALPIPNGVTVGTWDGMKRVLMDMTLLAGNYSIYIDCTTPLAKQRGIVVFGSGNTDNYDQDTIITNGAVTLEGEQSATELILGTSYGGIVFSDDAVSEPSWRAYIVAPILPPIAIASSDRATYPQSADLTGFVGTPASYTMAAPGVNYDTVEISGRWSAGADLTIGFAYDTSGGPGVANTCWAVISPSGDSVTVNGVNNRSLPVAIESAPVTIADGQPHDFYVSYNRADNSLSGRVVLTSSGVGSSFYVPLSVNAPRYDTPVATWDSAVTSLTIKARSGGVAFYRRKAVLSAKIIGGIMVGQRVSGSLDRLTIDTPTTAPSTFMLSASDRFIILDQ